MQIAVRRNDDPVFGPVVGVHVEHGRRVAQFDFHDVERLGVGRGDQRVFHDPVSRGAGGSSAPSAAAIRNRRFLIAGWLGL